MTRNPLLAVLLSGTALASGASAWAGQAPGAASAPDIPVSHQDRVYAAEQIALMYSAKDGASTGFAAKAVAVTMRPAAAPHEIRRTRERVKRSIRAPHRRTGLLN